MIRGAGPLALVPGAVVGIVEEIRGLEASRPLEPTFVRQQELQARLEELVRVELAEQKVRGRNLPSDETMAAKLLFADAAP